MASDWYHKASDQGHAQARSNLGEMYEKGEGVPQSYISAITLYRQAAEQGNSSAQYNLGSMHYSGKGVSKDAVLSYVLFNLAAASGHSEAIKMRTQMLDQLSGKELSDGQALSAQWKVGMKLPLRGKAGSISY